MNNSAAEDVMRLLGANGYGTIGTDLFAFEWKAGIDKQTLVLDQGGFEPELKDLIESPKIQILCRGERAKTVKDVHTVARSIYDYLISLNGVLANGTCYLEFEPQSLPTGIGRDENDRYVYTMNFYTHRNP